MSLSVLLLIIATSCFEEPSPPGIYIIYTHSKKIKCEQTVKMVIGKKTVCISKKPILGIQEVEYVTDILFDPGKKEGYIDVGISSRGIQTLNKIFEALPTSQFVFVLENSGLGRFTIDNKITNRVMRVGADLDLIDLKNIHNMLKKAQPLKSP